MSQSNGPVPLQQQVSDITNEPTTTVRTNLQSEFKAISDRLGRHPIHLHGALLQMLGADFEVRQTTMKDAIAEHQNKAAYAKHLADKKAAEDLDAEQKRIADANRPKLAEVGAPSLQ